MAYGYRIGEVPLPKITPIKDKIKFSRIAEVDLEIRSPIAVSLGCHVLGFSAPGPDPCDPYTMAAGVCKRVACKPPSANSQRMFRFREFVRTFVRKNFTPLAPDSDLSIETWLESTDYPRWRKDELLKAWSEVTDIWDTKYHTVKSFMKDETYFPDYKHARGIYARRDETKCFLGPVFKLIEKIVYNHPSFIKHVPVKDRPNYIMSMLHKHGSTYFATDYTAFESLFTRELMECCEFELYDYMTRDLPCHEEFMSFCNFVLAGINHIQFKFFWFSMLASRMSGEMCTSLGNGFTNLMVMLFLCIEVGSIDFVGVVEGDDGLFRISGPAPTKSDFESLGLTIKLETHVDISTASFCGIIFDTIDRCNIADPRKVLLNFGWGSSKYASVSKNERLLELLKCKSLSLAHQYPGCPIIQSLAMYGLRVTAKVPVLNALRTACAKGVLNSYQRSALLSALRDVVPYIEVGIGSRLLVEKLYGISVEGQFTYERYLNSLTKLQPLEPLHLTASIFGVCSTYSSTYVMQVPPNIRRPNIMTRSKFKVKEVDIIMAGGTFKA